MAADELCGVFKRDFGSTRVPIFGAEASSPESHQTLRQRAGLGNRVEPTKEVLQSPSLMQEDYNIRLSLPDTRNVPIHRAGAAELPNTNWGIEGLACFF